MPDWREYLTPDERIELDQIAAEKRAGQAQYRRIYDRCRKRMDKGGTGKPK
tara:strand:+ start:503 stop:655 length:153 start_codon:yes stop_codon:yes gene_type:complete